MFYDSYYTICYVIDINLNQILIKIQIILYAIINGK